MNPIRIHYLQYVAFEGPGYIETWAKQHGYPLTFTKFYAHQLLPDIQSLDWLVIMGGPMGVYDEHQYPWLKAEKAFIDTAIRENKTVIGICLGAQLVAEVLGAKVYANKKKEIGWFPVFLREQSHHNQLLKGFPKALPVLHWHGDTFDLPQNATHLMQTSICPNQAFLYQNKVLGLQFHMESTSDTLKEMVENCRQEIIPDEFVQTEQEILNGFDLCRQTNYYLNNILDRKSVV